MSGTTLLALEGVTVGYAPGAPILRGLDLTLAKGEVLGLVALDEPGGKSTVVRVAGGLLTPWSGRVLFEGANVHRMRFHEDQRYRARCATVLEGGALLVNQSVWDNVALPLRYHLGLRGLELERRVARLLGQAGYVEDPHAFPWQVGTRSRRLAAFARALARDPQLVVVDRFFEGLEMPDWKRMFELVLELNHAEGTTWLLVSELDPAIFQVADRVAVLEGGRLLACGHRKALFEDPRVREAFEQATGSDSGPAGGRPSGRARRRGESERVIVVDSGEALDLFSSGSDDELGGEDPELTVTIDGWTPDRPGRGLGPARGGAADPAETVVFEGDRGPSTPPPREAAAAVGETLTLDGKVADAVRAEVVRLTAPPGTPPRVRRGAAALVDPEATLTLDGPPPAARRAGPGDGPAPAGAVDGPGAGGEYPGRAGPGGARGGG